MLLQNNSARSAHRPPLPQQVFKQEVWEKNKSKGDGKRHLLFFVVVGYAKRVAT
ncbi:MULTISPECIES: hypothetical protein [Paenibacillus]|jgi:hypothetical protein|uniref:hypothetical protein n=1 Tax=Paenibacillus TaxID=44249 RepID=UPI000AC56768|nr:MULTISPECIES: hypothetical protein [Paenibacillus]